MLARCLVPAIDAATCDLKRSNRAVAWQIAEAFTKADMLYGGHIGTDGSRRVAARDIDMRGTERLLLTVGASQS
jgi:hypothetical protein